MIDVIVLTGYMVAGIFTARHIHIHQTRARRGRAWRATDDIGAFFVVFGGFFWPAAWLVLLALKVNAIDAWKYFWQDPKERKHVK